MTFDKRLFLLLFLGIFLSTVAGIIYHEFGHWVAFRLYGYQAQIGYKSTGMMANDVMRKHHLIEKEYAHEIDNNLSFPLKGEYEQLGRQLHKENVIITSAGPLLTMLAGFSSMAILLYYHSRNLPGRLRLKHWLLVFLALFCIRGLVNVRTTVMAIVSGSSYGNSDETKLSKLLGWPDWSLSLVSEIATVIILILLIFRIVPVRQRLPFFIALVLGEFAVVLIWLMWLGPILLP